MKENLETNHSLSDESKYQILVKRIIDWHTKKSESQEQTIEELHRLNDTPLSLIEQAKFDRELGKASGTKEALDEISALIVFLTTELNGEADYPKDILR